eukprot:XP_008658466.1 uncharacterized protein LOC100193954 isoform X2 [Zea mays]
MNCSSGHFFAMVKRFQSFSQMSFSRMGQGCGDLVLTLLVRKLQNALTSLDNFPVIMSHHFKLRSSIADIYKALNNYSMYPIRPRVAIIMGSQSNLPMMKVAERVSKEFNIHCEQTIVSAHCTTEWMM